MTDGPTPPRLRVLFAVAQSEKSPGARYRVFQYLPHLAAAGLTYQVVTMQGQASTDRSVRSPLFHPLHRVLHNAFSWMETAAVQMRILVAAPRHDRIVLYRIPLWSVTRWLLAPRRADIVTDFDDALDTIPRNEDERFNTLKRWILKRGLRNAILASTTTITSNAHNCVVVEGLDRRAAVIPTSIDMTRLPFRDRATPLEARQVIGWIGTPSTAQYLAGIEDALRAVQAARPVVIRLIGAGRNPFRSLDAEVQDWTFDTEPDALRRFDIGLMPMPDTPWTRGKAATKALQYGASGAPTVASRTATNLAILGEDDGTLFATTTAEWTAALLRLVDDAALRSALGRRAHARVAARFSVDANAPRLARLIRDPAGASLAT